MRASFCVFPRLHPFSARNTPSYLKGTTHD
nr:MAG TPA: hypothetical protein [Caudoviricetes sp.]